MRDRTDEFVVHLSVEEIPGAATMLSTGPVQDPPIRVATVESFIGPNTEEMLKKIKELRCLSFIVDLEPGRYVVRLKIDLSIAPVTEPA
jgi:hypothetical protein